MAFTVKSFAGGALQTTISADMTNSQTTASLSATPASLGWVETYGANAGQPLGTSGPFLVVFDYGQATEEKVYFTGISGSTLTGGTRASDGSTAAIHLAANAYAVFPVGGADDFYEANQAAVQTLGAVTTAGDLLVATGANALTRFAISGVPGATLTSNGSALAWSQTPGVTSGAQPISGGLLGANFTNSSMHYEICSVGASYLVSLTGVGAGNGSWAGGTAFTLPSGARPSTAIHVLVWQATASVAIQMSIATSGACAIINTGTDNIDLSGACFFTS